MEAPPVDAQRLHAAIEHTLLTATATEREVEQRCVEAVHHRFHGVCVQPVFVARCAAALANSGVRVVTVIGFPLGANRTETKVREAKLALADGADELDMVITLGEAKAGRWDRVSADIAAVVSAARGRAVKVILETGLLEEAEKRHACAAALAAGAQFVKTCTGFAAGQATVEDVRLLSSLVAGRAQVKASGGIRTLAQAEALLTAGASRLGTSSGVAIAEELKLQRPCSGV